VVYVTMKAKKAFLCATLALGIGVLSCVQEEGNTVTECNPAIEDMLAAEFEQDSTFYELFGIGADTLRRSIFNSCRALRDFAEEDRFERMRSSNSHIFGDTIWAVSFHLQPTIFVRTRSTKDAIILPVVVYTDSVWYEHARSQMNYKPSLKLWFDPKGRIYRMSSKTLRRQNSPNRHKEELPYTLAIESLSE